MERPITIHEMENIAGGGDLPDFAITSDLGNVVEISDANDSLGLGMLANPGRQRAGSGNGGGSAPPPPPPFEMGGGGGLAEVELGGLDTMEPIMLNVGGGGGSAAPMEIQFTRAESDMSSGVGGDLFQYADGNGARFWPRIGPRGAHGPGAGEEGED